VKLRAVLEISRNLGTVLRLDDLLPCIGLGDLGDELADEPELRSVRLPAFVEG